MEPGWGIVPLCHLDWARLVSYVDDIQPVGPAVGIVVVWDRVEFAVGQLVID